MPDLLAALRIIQTKKFFLLWIFFTAGKCTSEFGFPVICNIHDIQKFGREKYGLCQNSRQELFSNMISLFQQEIQWLFLHVVA